MVATQPLNNYSTTLHFNYYFESNSPVVNININYYQSFVILLFPMRENINFHVVGHQINFNLDVEITQPEFLINSNSLKSHLSRN